VMWITLLSETTINREGVFKGRFDSLHWHSGQEIVFPSIWAHLVSLFNERFITADFDEGTAVLFLFEPSQLVVR
jgi:hypothetical protein